MAEGRHLVYRYDGNKNLEDMETDAAGEIDIPRPGEIIERRNRKWKVHFVEKAAVIPANGLPSYLICLVSAEDKV